KRMAASPPAIRTKGLGSGLETGGWKPKDCTTNPRVFGSTENEFCWVSENVASPPPVADPPQSESPAAAFRLVPCPIGNEGAGVRPGDLAVARYRGLHCRLAGGARKRKAHLVSAGLR